MTKRIFLNACVIGLLLGPIMAQNLVINGGFERNSPKTAGVWQLRPQPCDFAPSAAVVNTSAQGWQTFEVQTPDLLVWDSLTKCPAFPPPHRGQRMLGLIMYHPFQDGQFSFDYHELVQGTLAKPLIKGETYRVSFWVLADETLGIKHLAQVYGRSSSIRPVFCGNFGFYFSDSPINVKENFMVSQLNFAVKPQINLESILDTRGVWRKITLAFTADRSGYKYFLFGNFFSDAVTRINMGDDERMALEDKNQTPDFWKSTKRIGYYLFDDFSIVQDPQARMEQALLVDKNYTLQDAILFDSGKPELRSGSEQSIFDLARLLQRNPGTQVEIEGHTDAEGDAASNQQLSEARAKSVYDALIIKGVAATQIRWKGYGEQKPIASNDTESGRQQNRRVTCRVLE